MVSAWGRESILDLTKLRCFGETRVTARCRFCGRTRRCTGMRCGTGKRGGSRSSTGAAAGLTKKSTGLPRRRRCGSRNPSTEHWAGCATPRRPWWRRGSVCWDGCARHAAGRRARRATPKTADPGMAALTVAVFETLDPRGQGGVVMRRPGRAAATLPFFRKASGQIDGALGERLVELLAALRGERSGVVLRPWENAAALHGRAMPGQVLIQGADDPGRNSSADGIRRQRLRHDGVRADDGARPDLDSRQDHGAITEVTGLVNGDPAHEASIKKLVHLAVVGQDGALRAEAAPIPDVDQVAGGHVDPGRGRQVDPLAKVHSHGPELAPPSPEKAAPEARLQGR